MAFPKIDINIEAAEQMGRLHDRLKEIGYSGHQLEVYLVRLLFCLFADDTGIFEHKQFLAYILNRTNPDGSDLAFHLEGIFEALNKPKEKRLVNIDLQLNEFPYINGTLFDEHIETAAFDRKMRETLIDCCKLDWSKISPAIFGAMFQSVMNDEERHDVGAHYTSEGNILKIIHPLFLDDLNAEFKKIKRLTSDTRRERLNAFHKKIANLKFLDPACGCGNFLVISYRELRLLEIEVIKELVGKEKLLDIHHYIKINVNQFYGIEIEEFPSKIAQTAMWLIDHQMNMQVRETFGEYFVRIPLTTSASIHCRNALTADWETIVPKKELSFILGNPPFLGSKVMSETQRSEVYHNFKDVNNGGILDYVTCWYKKTALYLQETAIQASFVSTNSICQGEQVPVLWPDLQKYGIKINFAHQTFKWSNEARGNAAVHCIIVGFSLTDNKPKKLYQYANVSEKPIETLVNRINAYLLDGEDIYIHNRATPLCEVPKMSFGNMPLDGGHLLLTNSEKEILVKEEPQAKKYIKTLVSAKEFLNGEKRWCIWLDGVEPHELKKMPQVLKRVQLVKKFRMASIAPSTQKFAETPALFRDRNNPETFILIPSTTSEKRKYIPIGFFTRNGIANNSCHIIPNATLYHFGVLTATMHMAWMRYVCGRLELRYRYSKDIVYNNFPWPQPTEKQKQAIETAAQAVLDTRALFSKSSLSDLYDPITMPPELVKAHQKLDRLVEKAYGRVFDDDAQRVAYLFERYQTKCGELFVDQKKRGKGRKAKNS
jgi:hypothetical protein